MEVFMNRKEFLKKLRKRLSFLKKDALEKEVLYYINKIDSSKLSDVEVISSFGSLDDIVKEVSKKYGISSQSASKKEFWFTRFYNDLINLSTILKNSDGKKRGKILLDILLLIAVTCVLKIPFIFVRDLGDRLTETIFDSNITILAIWGLVVEIFYVIVALSFFIRTFEKWFKNMK